MAPLPIEAVLRRDRAIILAGLVLISVWAWAYTVNQAARMGDGGLTTAAGASMAMPAMQAWTVGEALLVFVMWVVMMVAMMVPSATPMLLLFATTNRKRRREDRPFVPTGLFLIGYLAIWGGFSALATTGQWALHSAALLSPMMVSTSPLLGGSLLVAAGVFQWTPLKHSCLHHCRSPISFLTTHWREGRAGAFYLGLHHGAYCLTCCWLLMCLLFVTGIMNLLWVAIIAGLVLAEKVLPAVVAPWLARCAGVLLVGWGAWLILV